MKFLYSFIWVCLLPVVLLRLLWRSRKQPGYRRHWWHRLGFIPRMEQAGCIWIHAVSLGETRAAIPMIQSLLAMYPNKTIVLSHTTPSGLEAGSKIDSRVQQVFFPYDLRLFIHMFLNRLRASCLIVMETELWPNVFSVCAARQLPVVVVNARLSQRSAARYARFPSVVTPMMQCATLIAAQTQADADAFISIGAPADKITVTGSVKFELTLPTDLAERGASLRTELGAARPILLAASTHSGEETLLLQALKIIQQSMPDVLLVIVPRHSDRASTIMKHCQQQGFSVAQRSQQQACTADTAVYLADTMGELLNFYQASDVAFVGGSLVAHGGQNPLEPAACGKPILMGPHVFNFIRIVDLLMEANALKMVNDVESLATHVLSLLRDPAARDCMGVAGQQVLADNRGALEKQLAVVASLLPRT